MRLEQAHQLDLVPLRHREDFADRAAFDNFLDVPAALLVGIEEDVHLGHATEQVVQVAHDILVGADHEDTEVVEFAGNDAMERERVFDVLQVDELGDLAIGVAGDVDDHAVAIRSSR